MTATANHVTETKGAPSLSSTGVKKVIFASSLGTVFEWYDFYLYATLAPFFAGLFFPKTNETAAMLGSFVSYAAGFLVRPFGALVFGRIGDLVGRKYTFLVTILVMGLSTAAVGILPTYAKVGSRPTRKVAVPITMMVTRNVYLRPTKSPMRPKMTAPKGRTRKPAA